MDLTKKNKQRVLWWAVFLSALAPFAFLVWSIVTQNLGADPAKEIVLELGTWAINLLWVTLAITPIRKMFGVNWLQKYRRMMGLYCSFYTLLHLLAFATFIVGWNMQILISELTERPYAIVGFIAFLLLIPLTITSTKAMQKRLKKRWLSLHKLIYSIAILSLLHIIWQIRSDFSEALTYGLMLAFLLGYRVFSWKSTQAKRMKTSNAR